MQHRNRHVKAVSKRQPQLAVNPTLLTLFTFFSEVIGSVAVIQRQAPWKTPFPQFIFDPDADDQNNQN